MFYNSAKINGGRSPAKTWDAGLYLRLSRDDEKFESESISSQREILKRFVEQNSDIKVYDIYIDDGWSGTTFERPEFRRLESDLRAKKINCIIVKDLSRFARNCSEIGNYLSVVFPYLKTRFICINDNVDSYLDPESLDNISTKFKNLINEEYCHDISVKCKSSLTIRRQSGEYIGSFPCYGYVKDPKDYHKLIIDEESAEVLKRIYKLFLAGESMRGIVRILNSEKILPPTLYKKSKYSKYNPHLAHGKEVVWTARTIKRILTNQMYVGDLVQNVMNNVSYRYQKCRAVDRENWIIVPDTHQAIISRDDFAKVAELLKRDVRTSPTSQNLGVLSGFIKCGDCKRAMIKKSLNNGWKTYNYYFCSTYKNKGKELCTKHTISAEKVEEAVLAFLKLNIALAVELFPVLQIINNSPKRARESEKFKSMLEKFTSEKRKYLKLKADLYPDYKAGLIDVSEYEEYRKKYTAKLEGIEQSIDRVRENIDELSRGISAENRFISEFKKHRNVTELNREIVCALIENVYVYEDNRIEIAMKYRDEFETVIEYLNSNSALISKLNKLGKSPINNAGLPLKRGLYEQNKQI